MVDAQLSKAAQETKARARSRLEQTAKEMRKHVITAISAAFAFIIALTWRDAINDGLDRLLQDLGIVGEAFIYKLLAAVVVTAVCVMGIIFVAKLEKNSNVVPQLE